MHRNAFLRHILEQFPDLNSQQIGELISPQLISDFEVTLRMDVLAQAANFVRSIWNVSRLNTYQEQIKKLYPGVAWSKNDSLFMSYDFHVDPNGNLKLIEVNTNASFMVLGSYLYSSRGISFPVPAVDPILDLKKDILKELSLVGISSKVPFYIVDDNPIQQKLYSEFLVTQSLFRSWGFDTKILDTSEVPDCQSFVYNRSIDFLFEQPSSSSLKKGYESHQVCVSPNPKEYVLLADKQRMIEWATPGFLSSIGATEQDVKHVLDCLPQSRMTNQQDADQLWVDRKKLFFKPLRSYGSKQVYSGAKITKKVFDEIIKQDFIAQEFIPPAMVSEQVPFKYDLRFYAYQSEIRMVIARLYRGQTTNLQTDGGGFACVLFS